MTILGDIAQRTADAELRSWDEVVAAAGVSRFAVADLMVSYRVPDDFLRLAATIAPPNVEHPRGVREAPFAAVAVHVAPSGLPAAASSLAAVLRDAVGSVGIVAAAAHHPALTATGDLTATTAHLSGTTDLLSLQAIKGLEFDATLVIDPTSILTERPDGGPGGLYTALTRSTRALAILHTEPLPDALAASPELRHLTLTQALTHFAP
jgi:hypothetical protein